MCLTLLLKLYTTVYLINGIPCKCSDMIYCWLLEFKFQCNLDKESKLAIYRSYTLSNFNYCPLVCHFCGIQNSRNMEKIQERALRFVCEDYESTYNILLKRETMICYTYVA